MLDSKVIRLALMTSWKKKMVTMKIRQALVAAVTHSHAKGPSQEAGATLGDPDIVDLMKNMKKEEAEPGDLEKLLLKVMCQAVAGTFLKAGVMMQTVIVLHVLQVPAVTSMLMNSHLEGHMVV